jgi:hypothetical protein
VLGSGHGKISQTKPSPAKQIQTKMLGFIWFYSSESGLFNRLQRFQIKNLSGFYHLASRPERRLRF